MGSKTGERSNFSQTTRRMKKPGGVHRVAQASRMPSRESRASRAAHRAYTGFLNARGGRLYSAGREIRQAGRPRYPRFAALRSVRFFMRAGMSSDDCIFDPSVVQNPRGFFYGSKKPREFFTRAAFEKMLRETALSS